MTWDEFCGKVKTTVGKAADKINQTTDLATLQVKLNMADHKLEEAYAALGKVAYQHFSQPESSAELVAAAMTSVEEAQKAVDDIKAEIEKVKAEC